MTISLAGFPCSTTFHMEGTGHVRLRRSKVKDSSQ